MKILKTRKIKRQNKVVQIFITLLLLSTGLGFAYVQTVFSIRGDTTISKLRDTLMIEFDNLTVNVDSVQTDVVPAIDSLDPTLIYFSANLSSIHDFYEFEVDIVNKDSRDAVISNAVIEGISNDISEYINYTITYLGGGKVKINDILAAGSKERIVVRLEYTEKAARAPELFGGYSVSLSFRLSFEEGIGVERNLIQILGLDKKAEVDNLPSTYATANTGIAFGTAPSTTNGQGLYLKGETKNSSSPVYYYRGAVKDNNVVFAGYCWKIIRTTETGGTKLIYNGVPGTTTETLPLSREDYINVNNDEVYPFEYDSSTKKWTSTNHDHSKTGTIEFSVSTEGEYYFYYTVGSENYYDIATIYVDNVQKGQYYGTVSNTISLGNLTPSNVIKVTYVKNASNSTFPDNIVFSINKKTGGTASTCTNTTGTATQLSTTSKYNDTVTSLADVGFMYGTKINYVTTVSSNNSRYYGESVEYDDTTGEYTLTGTVSSSTASNRQNRHYTCNLTTNASCSTVYYVYYNGYSLPLTGGDTIETLKEKMFANENKSTILKALDTWYETNIESEENSKHYEKYLEDTVWCNDRSLSSGPLSNIKSNNAYSYFSSYDIRKLIQSALLPRPAIKDGMACPNIEDRFTVSTKNGNGAVSHPIGLLTADEATMAGNGYSGYSSSSYLYTGQNYWTMTPYYMSNTSAYVYNMSSNGRLAYNSSLTTAMGVRPVVSLKGGVKVKAGDGTSVYPYVIDTSA